MKGPTKECPACFHENPDDAGVCQSCQTEFDSGFGSEGTKIATGEITGFSKGELIAGRYRVVRELGRGGMGVVYLVNDTELRDRLVALKMVHPNLVAHPEARERFEDEVIIGQELTHSNIIGIHDLKRWEGLRFFSMEYIDGLSLREWLDRRKEEKPPFTLREVVSVIDPLLVALSYAHQLDAIHRDVKPENIMIMGEFPEVQIKVLDFGIAKTLSPSKFTHTAQALGTAYYMAPEQMKGNKNIDHRADLYSVGMILYEMLTGEMAVGRFHLPGELFSDLPRELDDVVEKALAPGPEERFKDAEEMREALRSALAGQEARAENLRQEESEQKRKIEASDLLEKGQAFLDHHQWSEAKVVFEKILDLEPGHTKATVMLKETEEKRVKLASLEKAAEDAEGSGNLKSAVALLDEITPLSQDQGHVEAWKGRLGQAVKKRREVERQEKLREEAELRKTAKVEELFKRGKNAFEARKWAEAEAVLIKVLDLDPDHENATSLLKQAKLSGAKFEKLEKTAKESESSGDIDGAIAVLDEIAPLSHDEGAVKAWKARLTKKLEPEPGRVWRETETGMKFMWAPEEAYSMGSKKGERDEKPVHKVRVDGFWIGKYPVTQGQWEKVMKNNPSHFKKGDDYPVEQVSWDDAKDFIKKLNTVHQGKYDFRLPTEAEWEYACRSGGKEEKYSGGDEIDQVAWYNENSGNSTHPVGTKAPNGLGIHDMSGNVWEWCEDVYNKTAYSKHKSNTNNPVYHGPGSTRVYRGGCWKSSARGCRSSLRVNDTPGGRSGFLGFRFACRIAAESF